MANIPLFKPRVPTADTRRVKPPPKATDQHYGTAAHKHWAAEVKARAHGQCQDPAHRGDRRADRGIADHIVERRDDGADLDLANGMWRCWSCHTLKTNAERAKRMRA